MSCASCRILKSGPSLNSVFPCSAPGGRSVQRLLSGTAPPWSTPARQLPPSNTEFSCRNTLQTACGLETIPTWDTTLGVSTACLLHPQMVPTNPAGENPWPGQLEVSVSSQGELSQKGTPLPPGAKLLTPVPCTPWRETWSRALPLDHFWFSKHREGVNLHMASALTWEHRVTQVIPHQFAFSVLFTREEEASVRCYPVSDTFRASAYLPQDLGPEPCKYQGKVFHLCCIYSYLYLLIMDSLIVFH